MSEEIKKPTTADRERQPHVVAKSPLGPVPMVDAAWHRGLKRQKFGRGIVFAVVAFVLMFAFSVVYAPNGFGDVPGTGTVWPFVIVVGLAFGFGYAWDEIES